jgi:hypothetical protein
LVARYTGAPPALARAVAERRLAIAHVALLAMEPAGEPNEVNRLILGFIADFG